VERLAASPGAIRVEAMPVLNRLLDALERGTVRAAEREGSEWKVRPWVKKGILLAFRVGRDVAESAPPFYFRDRDTLPCLDAPSRWEGIRVVPGGSAVRRGAHLDPGVVIMPPSYINVGAWVGEKTMIDSHVLVGSCAQVGSGVHLSAGVQIGGVLEPVGGLPVIVEDEVFVGGGCGVYDGTIVRTGAVLAAGVILTRSLALYDLPHAREIRAEPGRGLVVPERAVVVPGSRPARGSYAASLGIQLQAPVIVKYRDEATDAVSSLEEALR
jgi:2,3,4,5-tetrahydropyridine-2-carboxylate N-succinyltransferase